ncbi:hypothetical protein EST38_g3407 [Candolleomyces aberdarensis]|uniref:Uncharacterized protein n=1 Tax=Candolleomyces aberdarensis TaxID=2316362 RepID=A0A4V1Q4K9_9AGAR|nr:hypothetical protein EST38_g3407 [Candolleomyces aberdarensis]
MHAGRILRGHDLTQEVYGHLLDGDNNVIGLVIEATKGRSVQLGDRALVYEAVAKLQRQFCIFAGINAGTVLVHDGKVRFADMCCIIHYPPDKREDFDDLKEHHHWKQLEKLFNSLEEGYAPFPHYQFITMQPAIILSHSFSPERPLVAKYYGFMIFCLVDPDHENDSVRRTLSSGIAQSVIFEGMRDHEEAIGTRLVAYQVDPSVNHHRRHTPEAQSDSSRRRSRASTQRAIRQKVAWPSSIQGYYSKHPPLIPGPGRLYHRSIDSDCTSESGQSRLEEVF